MIYMCVMRFSGSLTTRAVKIHEIHENRNANKNINLDVKQYL